MGDLSYAWSNLGQGEGAPDRPTSVALRYFLSYFLDSLGFSDTAKLNFNFFIFLVLAGFSIYFAIGLFSDFKTKPIIQCTQVTGYFDDPEV